MANEASVDAKTYPTAFDAPASVQDQVATAVLYVLYQDHGGGQAGSAAAAWNGAPRRRWPTAPSAADYVAEGLVRTVKASQQVDATTVLGTLSSDPSIEIGWANLSEPDVTLAVGESPATNADYALDVSTGCEQSFNHLVLSPGGRGRPHGASPEPRVAARRR